MTHLKVGKEVKSLYGIEKNENGSFESNRNLSRI